MFDEMHEECGIFGIFGNDAMDAATACYYGLFALQHRGQESCGIAVCNNDTLHCHRNVGLVNDVFTQEAMATLTGAHAAIGHVRYGQAKLSQHRNAQPLVIDHIRGTMAVAHNGALTNAGELREELELKGAIFHTTSDAEVIAYTVTLERLTVSTLEDALSRSMKRLAGAYSLVVLSNEKLIAVRDPYGFHPLCIGQLGGSYVFASETCALDSIGATFLRDVLPGEIVIVDAQGLRSIDTACGTVPKATCVFEYIYFARPDSVIDGSSVTEARRRAGAFLALEQPAQADIVVGVPDSGIDAAIGFAQQSGIPYGLGFIKNKYIGRTFILPTQQMRETSVRIKLNPIVANVQHKRVVLVDDSIVRGTTCTRIVRLLRDAGASEVHVRSSAPPFMYPCYFGTDIDSTDMLIAHHHTMAEMREIIGADSLGFLSWQNATKLADRSQGFCTACFTGNYPCQKTERKQENGKPKRVLSSIGGGSGCWL